MLAPTWKTDHALEENPTVKAPCCGRHVAADMLVNIARVPVLAAEAEARRRPPYACDGCLERVKRTGKLKESELAEVLGADPTKIAQLKRLGR